MIDGLQLDGLVAAYDGEAKRTAGRGGWGGNYWDP